MRADVPPEVQAQAQCTVGFHIASRPAARRRFADAHPGLVKDVHTAFVASRDAALEHVDEVAAQAARWENFDGPTLATYFRTLDFSLGPRQIDGLVEFARRAAAVGAVDAPVTPRFADV